MLNFFKKQKVENSKEVDFESLSVLLPKTKREVTILQLVNEADMAAQDCMANGEHKVMVGDDKMSVNELVAKHKQMCDDMKAKEKADLETFDNDESDDGMENAEVPGEDEAAKKKALELAEHEEKEIVAKKKENGEAANLEMAESTKKNTLEAARLKKEQGKKNFDALKNAHLSASDEVAKVEILEDQVARGKSRYGSA